MSNRTMSAGTADETSTNVDCSSVAPQLQQCNVTCCGDTLYHQVPVEGKVSIGKGEGKATPLATLKDKYGGVCHIINDDHCYVVLLKRPNGEFTPTSYLFKEVYEVLVKLGTPV